MTYQEKKELALSYLSNKEKENDYRPLFTRIYPFSTENLTGFFNAELLKDKKILLTGSSCDQILTAQLYGAKKITHFDINPFVEFMYDLKKAAVKELERYEFLNYFYYNYENPETFRYKQYEKIRESLEGDSLDFWDTLYDNYSPLKIRRRLFILNNEEEMSKYRYLLPFMFIENYEKLKNTEFIPVEFIKSHILNLSKNLEDKYDTIYFSNILGRLEMIDFFSDDYIVNLHNFMKGILEHTEINGQILLNYFYGYSIEDIRDKKNIDVTNYIQYPISFFNCMNNISYKEMASISEEGKDTVLVYTKK